MKNFILIILGLTVLLCNSCAQKKTKAPKKKKFYYEGLAPKAAITIINTDSSNAGYLFQGENRIKVVLEGGVQNIEHKIFVTSKNAIVTKDPLVKNQYIVIPQKEFCEIIVDIQTLELYFWVSKKKGKRKKIVKEYPPKTYMVGYERYEVK